MAVQYGHGNLHLHPSWLLQLLKLGASPNDGFMAQEEHSPIYNDGSNTPEFVCLMSLMSLADGSRLTDSSGSCLQSERVQVNPQDCPMHSGRLK